MTAGAGSDGSSNPSPSKRVTFKEEGQQIDRSPGGGGQQLPIGAVFEGHDRKSQIFARQLML